MPEQLSITPEQPTLLDKQQQAERIAYRIVMQESGMFARYAQLADRFTIEEVVRFGMEGVAEMPAESRQRLTNSLNIAGSTIPYHPAWYKAYPALVATYPYQQLLEFVARDVAHYEQAYPFLFSAYAGGYQLIRDTLAAAKDDKLDRLLLNVQAHHTALQERAVWFASRPDDAIPVAAPSPQLLYSREDMPWAKSAIEWGGTKTDLVELGYALLESKVLKAPQGRAKAIEELGNIFGLKLGKPERLLQTIKKRRHESTLLDNLKTALLRFLDT